MPIVQPQIQPTVRQYTDLDISFQKHPTKKDIAKKVGDAAVIQALKNLVLLNFYEKPFQPHIGCNARKLLFDIITPINANILRDTILEVIKNNEPRVTVHEAIVKADYDNNRYSVNISFFINNRTEPTTVLFFLQRIR